MTILDIISEARALVDADSTSYPLTTAPSTIEVLGRRLNTAYEEVVGWLINADGTWQFDDTNYDDFPIGTYTLVNSQGRYSFNDKFLQLEEVQVKNKSGDEIIIPTIDQKEFSDESPLSVAFKTDGMPQYYDKVSDDTIELYPAPDNGVNVTLASGLKIRFKRTAEVFTYAELNAGSKVPGFATPYNIILAYMAALPYAQSYKPNRVPLIEAKIQQLKTELLKHYGRRQKDVRKVITNKRISFR